MSKEGTDLEEAAQLKKARRLITESRLMQMSFLVHAQQNRQSNDSLDLLILSSIPFANRLLKRIFSTASSVCKIIKKTGNAPVPVLKTIKVSPFVGIAFNILDFLQVPFLYLATFAMGQKPPFTLANNARWLFAAILLTLCLVAFFIPITAPIITIVSASLAFLMSAYTLSKLFNQYHIDKKSFEDIKIKIKTGVTAELLASISCLETACQAPEKNKPLIKHLTHQIELLKKQCMSQKEEIKQLYQDAYTLEAKVKIENDMIDNLITLALGALAVTGAVVSFFLPPIGFIMLTTTTLACTAYFIVGLTSPFFPTSKDPFSTESTDWTETMHENTQSTEENNRLLKDYAQQGPTPVHMKKTSSSNIQSQSSKSIISQTDATDSEASDEEEHTSRLKP